MATQTLKKRKDALRGPIINPNAGVENQYRAALHTLISAMVAETQRELLKLYRSEVAQEYFTADASITSQARMLLSKLQAKFESLFAQRGGVLAAKFAKNSDAAAAAVTNSTIRELAKGMSFSISALGKEDTEMLKAVIVENTALIRNIPTKYFAQVTQAAMVSITSAQGDQQLKEVLHRIKGVTYRQAALTSMDQTRKAMEGLTRARLQRAGLKEFEWVHISGSKEPRKLHIEMSGNIYRYDNPPVIDKRTGERGFPGQAINCRCRSRAVIRFTE